MGGSDDDTGRFEFGQSADSTGEDPPDQPDPPDSDGGEPTTVSQPSTAASTKPTGSESDDEPTDEPTNEPSTTPERTDTAKERPADAGGTQSTGDGGDAEQASNSEGSDAPDPPDPSDDGGSGQGGFEFDPVTESQKAFEFAEQQSRAAAESAYSRAKQTWFWKLLKRYTSPEVRQRLDEVFSRRMLGSVLVGSAFTKIIESGVEMALGASGVWRPVMWTVIFVVSTVIFVWWDQLSRRASEAAEKASEAASEAAEKASETAEKASETASEAAEKASEATDGEPAEPERPAEVVGAGVSKAAENRAGGATAATRAGGKRPSAVRSRSRAPDRRPNKRFATPERAVDGVDAADADESEPVYEGEGFKNPGRAGEPAQGR